MTIRDPRSPIPGPPSAMPASFLIVRLGALGDIVHALPVVAALREVHQTARIGWLVQPRFAALLELVEGLDHVHAVDRRRVATIMRQVRGMRYGVCLDLQGLLKSAALARLSGSERVVGFSRPLLREPAAALAYSQTGGDGSAHVLDKNLSLLETLGIRSRTRRFPLRLPDTPVVSNTRQILRIGSDAPFALVNPGAAWPNKQWPPDRFAEVARRLHEARGLKTAVLWGPDEATLAAAVARASGGAAQMAPQTTMVEAVALSASATVMLSGDTGPLHLAAAVGTPVVGLFGPTPPERNGPWNPRDRVVSVHAQCACVFKRRCTAAAWCLAQVSVADVMSALDARLAGTP